MEGSYFCCLTLFYFTVFHLHNVFFTRIGSNLVKPDKYE